MRGLTRLLALSSCFVGALQLGAAARCEELHWYRGNTHTHTSAPEHSDANETPDFVARWYRDHGYQFLVITDHEHLTRVDEINRKYGKDGRYLAIRGQEITQMVVAPQSANGVRHAHVNGINIDRLIRPVSSQGGATMAEIAAKGITLAQSYERNLAAIRSAGGLAQVNHPNLQWSVGLDDLLPITQPFLLEVWNAFPTSNNLGGTDDSGHQSPSAEGLWDELLTHGKVVWGVGSDDAHSYHQFDRPQAPSPGRAWVVVRAPELTTGAIVKALSEGDFYASTGIALKSYDVTPRAIELAIEPLPEWSPSLVPSTRYVTRFIGSIEGSEARVLAEVHGTRARYVFRGNEKYVRASIIDSDGRRAWTQPVFRDGRTK